MLLAIILNNPVLWIIPWIFMGVAYYFVLKKMGLKKMACVIPFLAEREMSTVLFERMRTFYRPFIISLVMCLAGYYLDPAEGQGRVYMIIALVVYGVFLMRLYWRLKKSFGKGIFFYIGLLLLPPVFLLILGCGKSQYHPLELKPIKDYGKVGNAIRRAGFVLISAVEVAVLVFGVGTAAIRTLPPSLMVAWESAKVDDAIQDIKADNEVLSREDMMGDAAATLDSIKPSRELFFPDHSQDKNVVVLTYIVGSDLEHKMGLASANIRQMVEATKQGSNLSFVVEAGGCKRWFTRQIEDSTYGRYLIKDGEIEKIEDLPQDTCMADQDELESFLKWGNEKYPADRYMLVLWDHGGGVALGYGNDDLNEAKDSELGSMPTSKVIEAIKNSGIKFDLIGFDACLMQDLEISSAMEPYTDYYLASEEVEGGYGWYYTEAFGKLAAEPGSSTEEFGRILLSDYDQLNGKIKELYDDEGGTDIDSTLSLVDTTLAKPAYDKVQDIFVDAEKAIKEDTGAFASVAAAGTQAYSFHDDLQIDLVDFLNILSKSDYDDKVCSDEKIHDAVNAVQASVLFRNKASAEGINGTAFAFPYKAIGLYGFTQEQLKAMSRNKERSAFNTIFSIIAAQKAKAAKDPNYMKNLISESISSGDASFNSIAMEIMNGDLTQAEWYVKGFEDYDTTKVLVDIPLKETEDGYEIQAPEKVWDIIADVQTMVYKKDEESGNMIYLGRDHVGTEDADGHAIVSMGNSWIHIGGQLVCYEAEPVRETDEGDVYSGKVKARLNDKDDIILNIEWEPVKDGEDATAGHIVGYDMAENDIFASVLNSRDSYNLKAGDRIQFIFDTYDGEGNLVSSEPDGKTIRVTKQSRLKVEDAPIGEGSISIGGALTDIYQRIMTTEMVDVELQ